MKCEKIQLTEDSEVFLETFVASKNSDFVRKAILIIPGGAYSKVCADREGEPIAQAFMPHGYNAFVLHYTVDRKKTFPQQLIEASLAMKHIKDNANKYNIDPEKIIVVGFSAGGHLAGCLGTMWNKKEIYDAVDMPLGYNKPLGMILLYPAINAHHGHYRSFFNLHCKDELTQEEFDALSIDKNVDENTVPAFIAHSIHDEIVSVKDSLDLAQALAQSNKRFEMHIYTDVPHGFALANDITNCGWMESDPVVGKWVELAVSWAQKL